MPADPEKLLEDIRDALRNLPDSLANRLKSAIGDRVQPAGWGDLTTAQQSDFLGAEKMVEDWKAAVKEQREEDKATKKFIDDWNKHRLEAIENHYEATQAIPGAVAGVGGSASRALGGLGLDVSPITNAISGVKDFIMSIVNLVDLIRRANHPIPDEMLRPSDLYSGGTPTVMPLGQAPQTAGLPGAVGGVAAGAGGGQTAATVLAPTVLAPTPYSPGGMAALNVPAGMTGAALMGKAGGAFGGVPFAMGAVPQSLPLPGGGVGMAGREKTDAITVKLDENVKIPGQGEGPGDLDESENVENVPPLRGTEIQVDGDKAKEYAMRPVPKMEGASGPARPLISRSAISSLLRNAPHPAARFASIFI